MYTLILPDPFAPPTAPAEDDAPLPTAATELSNAARTEDAEPSDGTPGETLADPSPVAVADTPSEAATVIDGAVSDVAAGPGASPAKDDDLEVEALVQADAAAPSPAATLESSVPTSPLPTSSDLPVSPPAPHRSLPPTFPKAGLVGLTVYYPVQLSNRVPVAQLKRQRWTDASNKFDEECGEEEMDWSDDEAEAAAKRRKKLRCVRSLRWEVYQPLIPVLISVQSRLKGRFGPWRLANTVDGLAVGWLTLRRQFRRRGHCP